VRAGFLQFEVAHGDPAANLSTITEAVSVTTADLLVLPELCTTGYLFESSAHLEEVAEPLDGQVVTTISRLAVERSLTVVFGIAERERGRVFNTAVIASSDGSVFRQRKRHLTRLESRLFARGDQASRHRVPQATLGVAMCFDAWFSPRVRILSESGIEVLCCPSNFGGADSLDVFRVRAMENRIFVIVANRIGSEALDATSVTFRGASRVIAPDGTILCAADGTEALTTVVIDPTDAKDKTSVMCDDLHSEWAAYATTEHARPSPRLGT
jgi:predicted amidohydrolase